MAESKAGPSPVAVQRHGNTRGPGGSISSINSLLSVREHHVRAEKKHQHLKHDRLNATSSSTSGAVVGAASSNALCGSASKDAVKKIKGKETEFSNINVVDLTADSPQNDDTRLTFAVNNAPSGLSFLRRHHRVGRTHRLPIVSNEGHSEQVPFEADISVLDSRQMLEPNRGYSTSRAFLPPGEISGEKASNQKTSEMQRSTDYFSRDVSVNPSSSSGGRKDTDRLLPKLINKSADPLESNDKGKSTVTPVVDCQASGRSSEPERLPLWKRKRSPATDATKSRQRFKPPRMVSGGSTSGSPFGGMQRPIDVDDVEEPSSSGVENDIRAVERARQIEEDEMLAKFLQQEYGSEVGGGSFNMDDAQLAQMLQDEENGLGLQQRTESTSQAINASPLQAARREMQRVLPTVRSPAARPATSSSRMRILRNLHNRSSQHVMRGRRLGGRMINANEPVLHFPEGLGLEARVEFLAALETASQASLSILDQVDRDFNEDDYEMLLALDDTSHAPSGASYDKIEQLPISVIKPTDVSEEACSICLETPVVDDVVRRLPCMHVFHLQCIDEWLERQANCPICKMEL